MRSPAVPLVALRALTSFGIAVAIAFTLVAFPSTASAVGPCDDPDPPPTCFETYTDTDSMTLTVSKNGGTVTSSPGGITCGSTCTMTLLATRECDAYDCTEWDYPAVTLTATGLPAGYAAAWPGNCAMGATCAVTLDNDKTVALNVVDVTLPSVSFNAPANGKVSRSTALVASGSDNSGSITYRWWADNVLQGATGNSITLASVAVGSHSVAVATLDPSGNQSSTVTRTVLLDDSTAISLGAIPAFVNQVPVVTFTAPADAASTTCAFWGSGPEPALTACSSGESAAASGAADGTYNIKVKVTDNVGNVAIATGSFVLDRTQPLVAITGGPSEGQQATGSDVTFTYVADDDNLEAVYCQFDSGAEGACATPTSMGFSGLAAGPHKFTVRGVDKAGNSMSFVRNFSVPAAPGPAPEAPGSPAAPVSANPAVLSAKWAVKNGKTKARKMVVSKLPPGASVTVACKGRGCAFKSRAASVTADQADLTKLFKRRALAAKSRVTVTIAAPGHETLTITFITQKKKAARRIG